MSIKILLPTFFFWGGGEWKCLLWVIMCSFSKHRMLLTSDKSVKANMAK